MKVEATANLPGFGLMRGDQADLSDRDPEVRRALELGTLREIGGGIYDATVAREAQQTRGGCRGCGGGR